MSLTAQRAPPSDLATQAVTYKAHNGAFENNLIEF